jgi:hypothetical protein
MPPGGKERTWAAAAAGQQQQVEKMQYWCPGLVHIARLIVAVNALIHAVHCNLMVGLVTMPRTGVTSIASVQHAIVQYVNPSAASGWRLVVSWPSNSRCGSQGHNPSQ